MVSQPKTPLKVVGFGSNFCRKLNLYQGIELYWSGPLENHIRNFISGGISKSDKITATRLVSKISLRVNLVVYWPGDLEFDGFNPLGFQLLTIVIL